MCVLWVCWLWRFMHHVHLYHTVRGSDATHSPSLACWGTTKVNYSGREIRSGHPTDSVTCLQIFTGNTGWSRDLMRRSECGEAALRLVAAASDVYWSSAEQRWHFTLTFQSEPCEGGRNGGSGPLGGGGVGECEENLRIPATCCFWQRRGQRGGSTLLFFFLLPSPCSVWLQTMGGFESARKQPWQRIPSANHHVDLLNGRQRQAGEATLEALISLLSQNYLKESKERKTHNQDSSNSSFPKKRKQKKWKKENKKSEQKKHQKRKRKIKIIIIIMV